MTFLTDFADQAVILPVMLLVAVVLALLGWRRGAIAWLVGVSGTLGVMLLLKLLFSACGDLLPGDIHSPSGHTAAAAVTYGGIVALLGASGGTALATALGAAIIFGVSRLELGVHTPTEVLLGGAVGLAGAALLVRLAGRRPAGPRQMSSGLLAACVIGFLLFHGTHVRAETTIGRLAQLLEVWPLAACKG